MELHLEATSWDAEHIWRRAQIQALVRKVAFMYTFIQFNQRRGVLCIITSRSPQRHTESSGLRGTVGLIFVAFMAMRSSQSVNLLDLWECLISFPPPSPPGPPFPPSGSLVLFMVSLGGSPPASLPPVRNCRAQGCFVLGFVTRSKIPRPPPPIRPGAKENKKKQSLGAWYQPLCDTRRF